MRIFRYGISRAVLVIIIAIAVAVGVVGYYALAIREQPQTRKTMTIFASISEMTTADPSTEFSNSIRWLPLVYETLLWYDPIKNEFIPALAERYESRDDGMTWVFYIRRGAKFHDNTPVTAHAVKLSIERTIALGQGAAFIWAPVNEIEVVDDYTVVFKLKYPAPLNKIAASGYGAYIFSPKVVELAGAKNLTDPKVAEWLNRGNDAGSGPYRLIKWEPETEVVLEKWPEWWGWKLPGYPLKSDKAPDIYILKIIKDAVTQERLLLAGDIDVAQYVPLEDLEKLKGDPKVQVVIKPSFQNLLMLINTKKPPLNNVLVRRAIAHAIPYEDIVKIARSGLARIASGPIPHGMWGHFDNLTYTYDLDLAKRLLAEAGYPNGVDRPLLLVYTAGDIYEKRTAELIAVNLAKIGINVEIRPMSWEEQWALAQRGWEDPEAVQDLFLFYWWPTYITPFDFLYNMFHSESKAFNLCYYENQEFEKLIMEASVLEGYDQARALEMYYKAQQILYRDVPAVPLWDMIYVEVGSRKVGNLDKAINPAYPTAVFAQVLSIEE
ncbi:MAG: ABC transporter substrate-binding protein [Ignisphaera sp.]|nr:ABC transporter substrate-binding protein [Ignisphaera sp.]MDW8084819.1 ABC transporter substrate-binding protein [Ignisphaera sp.]